MRVYDRLLAFGATGMKRLLPFFCFASVVSAEVHTYEATWNSPHGAWVMYWEYSDTSGLFRTTGLLKPDPDWNLYHSMSITSQWSIWSNNISLYSYRDVIDTITFKVRFNHPVHGWVSSTPEEWHVHPGPPDTCGPVDFQGSVTNPGPGDKNYAIIIASDPEETIASFTLEQGQTQQYNIQYDELCDAIGLWELNEDGFPLKLLDTILPDTPTPPDSPIEPPEEPVDTPVHTPNPEYTPIEDSILQPLLEDPTKSDIEKQIESDHILWQRTDQSLKDIEEAIEGGNGQGQPDYTSLLEEIRDNVKEHNERDGEWTQRHLDALDANPTEAEMTSEGQSAANAAAALVPQLSYTGSFSPGGAPEWNLAIMEHTFNMNPFQFPQMVDLANWIRLGFAFFFIVGFATWAGTTGSEYVRALPQVNQAKGNAAVGGTGAQGTALVAAGLITVAIATALVAIFSWATYDIGIGDIASMMGYHPFNGSGVVANAMWLLDQFIPLGGYIGAVVGKIIWRGVADTAFVVAMAFIRFIVP